MAGDSDGPEVVFLAKREVRTIPAGWHQPLNERGKQAPLSSSQMPDLDSGTEIVAYETTSQGMPISPPFSSTPEGRLELVRYCVKHCTTFANHRASERAWTAILFGPEAVITADGIVQP